MPKVLNKFTAHLLSVFILAGLFLAPSGIRAADASNRQADVITAIVASSVQMR